MTRAATPIWCAIGLALLAGCSPEPASFDSREPGARLEATFKAVEAHDKGSTRDLIRMLDSDDPAERLVAIRSLERLTGQTFGYDHAAPEDERAKAVERWVAWEKSAGDPSEAGKSR